ncbi:TPA: hypothetical protein SHD04_001409 [Campylobacter coli]|uniref:Uncharacterized protein n=1 Tax=Helicobacter pullorum TaxID=35818 RepID=A0A0N1EB05_9HELI|nr:hypothetical protein [Helicobacter pullorum]HEH5010488.1 hypothetical protein [Campylobacter coli]KPH55502.1 hypothetical protein HPU229334_08105 [Helicobacter pullorum]HEH5040473.1 hypothetical protein [Campylobacter coli]HEH5151492.1 hypothetical protein [Campylobacter coli]HEH5389225.1 hypothetical protein [Campylobacter coli]
MVENQRDTNQRGPVDSRNQGTDRWNGYAPKDLTEDFGQSEADRGRNIFNVLSEIQRYYVIEERSEEIPKEYFTIEQILEYFKIGFKSGLMESFIFVTLVPILQIIYPSFKFYFLDSNITDNEILFFKIISYTPIILTTLFVIYIGKYYQGYITRRAIFSLMNGRSVSFIVKGIIFYFLLQWFIDYSLSHPKFLYGLSDWTSWIIGVFSDLSISIEAIYKYYYAYVIPAMDKASISILSTMMFFAILPYFTIFFISYFKRARKQRVKEEFEQF